MLNKRTRSQDVAVLKVSAGVEHVVRVKDREEEMYGNMPRSAKVPKLPLGVAHWMNISASNLALSLDPDARKCGSAASNAPSRWNG